ncbi:MAG: S49 family peptidase [Candidatus Methanospirareceae archaeon]
MSRCGLGRDAHRTERGRGTAGASWEIYRAVKRVEKPVVASIGDNGASGAYLVAVAADEIVDSKVIEVDYISR